MTPAYPDGWPDLDGEPLTLQLLGELLLRRNAWAEQVQALGIDAPPFPLTVEEEQAVRDVKLNIQMLLLVTETERFLENNP